MRHFLLSILILIPASASADALVTMRADGSLGAIGSIYQNGVFSGLASDVIEITGDEAQFDLKFDGGYEVSLAVSIERGGLQVSAPVFGDHSRSRSVKELSAPISVEVDGTVPSTRSSPSNWTCPAYGIPAGPG